MAVVAVVPAFREASDIARVIRTMPKQVDRIILVDDASDDGTAEAALACGDSRLVVVRHGENRGVGAAIATGYRAALASPGEPLDAFVVMAGDGQMDPADLPALIEPLARGAAGYVKGNRFARPDDIPPLRYWGGRAMSALTRAALGVCVEDSQCGYTAISRDACARLDLAALWPRFGYPNDLLGMLVERRVTIAEVPVRPVYTKRTNKLRAWHVPVIGYVVVRAALRAKLAPKAALADDERPCRTGHRANRSC